MQTVQNISDSHSHKLLELCKLTELTVLTEMTELTENLKKYDLITDNLKARDASASKKLFLSALTRLHVIISEKKEGSEKT